jgi:hypothetical protein
MRVRDKTANSKRTCTSLSPSTRLSLITPHSQRSAALPVQKDCQALFYDKYHEMAKGYDEDFVKKYGGDLDTTLIFVGFT